MKPAARVEAAVLAGVLLALGLASARADSTSGAGQILEMGAGARSLGMGSAFTAVSKDVTSLYYNPAGLGLLENKQIQLMQASLFEGAKVTHLGYAQNFKKRAGGWGLQLIQLSATGSEGRDKNNEKAGGFTYAETALGAGWGFRGALSPDLSIGGGLNMLTRTLGPSSDKHLGINLGTQYGPVYSERLTLGLAFHNLVSKASGDTDDRLPRVIRVGAAYRVAGPMLVALDISSAKEFRIGTEYTFGIMSLRAGMAPDGVTFGGGMLIKKAFSFDLALVNNSNLGMAQKVSIGYRFGTKKPKKTSAIAEEYLSNAMAEFDQRNYMKASKDFDAALGLDPDVVGREWKRKAARLRELLKDMEFDETKDLEALQEDVVQNQLMHRAVQSYLVYENSDAMMLAHVAAGGTSGDSVHMRLLRSMSKATRQEIAREDILPPPAFVQERLRRTVEAIHAKRYDAAIRACQEALRVQPDDAQAWMRLGSSYFASGNKKKALEAYNQALHFQPDNAKLREFIKDNFKD